MTISNQYDIIVVGGGHAGVEACNAAVKMGMKTLLICLNFNMVANMPCNPHIGGSAKGIVVREIDALGGLMGKMADSKGALLQIKELNTSKGPGVRCLRAQEDKIGYPKNVQSYISNLRGLDILEGEVVELIVENHKIKAIKLSNGEKINCKACILCCGTHLESRILRGHTIEDLGPDGEKSSHGLSKSLTSLGMKLIRLKTGTPPRIKKESIDFSKLSIEEGEDLNYSFSYDTTEFLKKDEMLPCHLTYTSENTHEIIRNHLTDSAMYGGVVEGVGPRYCPSIEDKVVRFKDKTRHQLFIEPESKLSNSMYLDGFSTSMPIDVQVDMVHTLQGFEKAEFLKYAYAIEYDAISSSQLDHTLQTKNISGLYIAGQLAGTSGYEEAAALGLMASINASLCIQSKKPLVLNRDQAYIGIMINDIVTKLTTEPYRLLSSRSEYRLITRSDNADSRLLKIGYDVGLNSKERYDRIRNLDENVNQTIKILSKKAISTNKEIVNILKDLGYEKPHGSETLLQILKRQKVNYAHIKAAFPELPNLNPIEQNKCEIEVKYEGYIKQEYKDDEKRYSYRTLELPDDLNYLEMQGLSLEAREKLNLIRPKTLGEASNIANVHPSDIDVLSFYIRHK